LTILRRQGEKNIPRSERGKGRREKVKGNGRTEERGRELKISRLGKERIREITIESSYVPIQFVYLSTLQ
jgi:hypothetical protein